MCPHFFKQFAQVVFFAAFVSSNGVLAQDFISLWKTDNPGVSQPNQIRIPGTGFIYSIIWEEVNNPGNNGIVTATNEVTLTFPHSGLYRIRISGNFTRIRFNNTGDRRKILDIESWGNIQWSSMDEAFYGCQNLQISANDAPDLSRITSLKDMFNLAINFNSPVNHWDVSTITDLTRTFSNTHFNQPLNSWNVSNVTTLLGTFRTCLNFNQNIDSWDVSKVENFVGTFFEARSFNQPLNSWNVSHGRNFASMFQNALVFNQPLGSWDLTNAEVISAMFAIAFAFDQPIGTWNVSNITQMNATFSGARSFNQDLSLWDVSKVTNMGFMFAGAWVFNQDISNWNISNVTIMEGMFFRSKNFNQPVGKWIVENVTSMHSMFRETDHFNQPLTNWRFSKVTNMTQMFMDAKAFNQDIKDWDVQNVTSMLRMFQNATRFNADISGWNVAKVKDMTYMFENASSFNQNIGKWNVVSVEKMAFLLNNAVNFNYSLGKWDLSGIISATNALESALRNTNLSVANYDSTLIGWATKASHEKRIPTRIKFGAHNLSFCQGAASRSLLQSGQWEIIDSGADCSQTITFALQEDMIYGDTILLKAFSSAALPITYTTEGPGLTFGDTLVATGTGLLTITATQSGNNLFDPAQPVSKQITIIKAKLIASIHDTTKKYGDPNPSFAITYQGFRNNDDEQSISAPSIVTTADQNSDVGEYTIDIENATALSPNYEVDVRSGILSITHALLEITALDTFKTYGEPNPSFRLTYNGFIDDDREEDFPEHSLYSTADNASPVGIYTIDLTSPIDSIIGNYVTRFSVGTLSILKAPLEIEAVDTTKIYGESIPEFRLQYRGFVNGDDENSLATFNVSSPAVEDSRPGLYPINLLTDPHSLSINYKITFIPGILTIEKASLSLHALDTFKIYGESNPEFTFDSQGSVTNEALNLLHEVVLGTPALDSSDVGVYDIHFSHIPDQLLVNYTVQLISGKLIINRAEALIAVSNLLQEFDGTEKSPSVHITPGALSYTLVFANSTSHPTDPGLYPFMLTITDGNYFGTLTDTLVITPLIESHQEFIVSLFPNPVVDELVIVTPEALALISIYNSSGVLVYQAMFNSNSKKISITNLQPGPYLIELRDEHGHKSFQRILKQ